MGCWEATGLFASPPAPPAPPASPIPPASPLPYACPASPARSTHTPHISRPPLHSRCPTNWTTCGIYPHFSLPVSRQQDHLRHLPPPFASGVPPTGPPVAFTPTFRFRCPANRTTSGVYPHLSLPVSHQLDHQWRLPPPFASDVPPIGPPAAFTPTHRFRCPTNWTTGSGAWEGEGKNAKKELRENA